MKKLVLALVALAAAVAVATPAMADFNFYGSMRLKTYYKYDDNKNANADSAALQLATNSRFGANASTGDIGGRVELGMYDASTTYLRLLYGTWKTDAGTLLIGQTYTPYFGNLSSVTNNDDTFNGYGATYDGRTPMIRFDMTSGAYVAAIKNAQTGSAKAFMPKLAVGFKNKAGALSYNVGVAYQTYDKKAAAATGDVYGIVSVDAGVDGVIGTADDVIKYTKDPISKATAANPKRTVTSYLTYADIGFKQDDIRAKVKLHYGQNLKDFGITKRSNSAYDAANNLNTISYGGQGEVGFGMVTVGATYTVDDKIGASQSGNNAVKNFGAFVNAAIKPVKGFTIVPEIAYFDKNVNGFDFDGCDEIYGYVKWQMDF